MKSKYVRKSYSPTECAYLAGIIDGEGSIYIGKFIGNRRSPHYQTNIEVSNTSEELIDWLHSTFGGARSEYTPNQTPKNSRKKVYRWSAWSDQVEHLCELIQPYIVIKKRQVEVMIIMRKTFERNVIQKGIQGVALIPHEILAIRESCWNELRSLHARNHTSSAVSPSALPLGLPPQSERI